MESLNITANIYAKEPCMINPSCYESLLEVMDNFRKTCSVASDKERKWTVLASDSVPHILAFEIQDNLKQCRSYSI